MSFFDRADRRNKELDREEYKLRVENLRNRMLLLQKKLRESDFPVLILISGVDGAGKGESINLLNEWFDPRYLQTFAFGNKTDEELQRPDYWRFWRSLPGSGRIGLYVGSWYSDPIGGWLHGLFSRKVWFEQLQQVCRFEKLLVEEGALILKFWLHLNKEDQRQRMDRLSADPATSWRVTDLDWEHLRIYDRFVQTASEALELSDQPGASWRVIYGRDPRYRSVHLAEQICERIEQRLMLPEQQDPTDKAEAVSTSDEKLPAASISFGSLSDGSKAQALESKSASGEGVRWPTLDGLDLSLRLGKKDYKQQLEQLQGRLNKLSRQAWQRGIASILLFEGWDAAGKGGIIRRILPAMDARHYRVIPIAAPNSQERRHHYLWRFWKYVPGAGRTVIFDRSWYGRVLVERIEQFAEPDQWQRAYGEIRDFEQQLLDHGIVLVKYWLHISQDEQLERFRHRELTPHKQHKITEEDYRNRQRWPEYEVAVNQMVEQTSTPQAPWLLIEGNDKRFARIKALQCYCDRLQAAIEHRAP